MTKNSWLAATGLCILLATSLVQAHPITLDAEGPRTSMFCWQKVEDAAFLSSSAGASSGNCLRQKRLDRDSLSEHLAEGTLGRATDFIQLDSSHATNFRAASAFGTGGGLSSLTPVLSIDPAQVISAAGTIGRSIGNGIRQHPAATPTTNVPEPETWALMMLGLIGATVATRARRRRAIGPSV